MYCNEEENTSNYFGQMTQMRNLCLHLRRYKHLIQFKDEHFLYKPESHFRIAPVGSLALWKDWMCLSIDPIKDKLTKDNRDFFIITPSSTQSKKRKRKSTSKPPSKTISTRLPSPTTFGQSKLTKQRQGRLLKFHFSRTLPPSSHRRWSTKTGYDIITAAISEKNPTTTSA